jgi:hypothetical protein
MIYSKTGNNMTAAAVLIRDRPPLSFPPYDGTKSASAADSQQNRLLEQKALSVGVLASHSH